MAAEGEPRASLMWPSAAENSGARRPFISPRILARFAYPDEVRRTTLGQLEVVSIAGMTFGRVICLPGWRWSVQVGRQLGKDRCDLEHIGLVTDGATAVSFADGRTNIMHAGDLFYVPPEPHDLWVLGGDPYVAIYFLRHGFVGHWV
jgi:hypothetical protein